MGHLNLMATRAIIVEFEPGTTPYQIAEFRGWLRELAASTQKLVRMTCGEHFDTRGDAALSANAPAVVFGNFVSVWEFEDEQALENFVTQPFHRSMASSKFRSVVRRRYVVNIR